MLRGVPKFCFSLRANSQVYNGTISFEHAGRYFQAWYSAPSCKVFEKSGSLTLSHLSFKALTLRSVDSAARYMKGAVWTNIDLSVTETLKLSLHDFKDGPLDLLSPKRSLQVAAIFEPKDSTKIV